MEWLSDIPEKVSDVFERVGTGHADVVVLEAFFEDVSLVEYSRDDTAIFTWTIAIICQ